VASAIFRGLEVRMFLSIIGFAVAGATFAFAKNRGARTGTAAAAATTAGVGSAVVGSLVLASATVVLPLAAIGGIGYFYFKRGNKPKALRAGR
jgi:hypothetical protein